MATPVFINKDAEWLDELGVTFLEDGDLQTGVRLRQLAVRLQQLDDRVLTIQSDGAYAAGRQSVFQELYAKSNLPPEYHHKVNGVKYSEDKIRKMPAGMTTEQLKAREVARQVTAAKKSDKFAGLSLNLNLEILKK